MNGTGYISDPFNLFGGIKEFTAATFTGTATPDGANPGRYTMSPLVITPSVAVGPTDFTVAIYQASGGQLFWLDEDTGDTFQGPLEQQAAVVTPLPSAKVKPQASAIQKK